jgi:hypothetical protein
MGSSIFSNLREDLSLADALIQLDKYAVLIIDVMGYVKKSSQ